MSVQIGVSPRVQAPPPIVTPPEIPPAYMDLINKLITIINEDHDIVVSETEPLGPHEDGDVWYKPSEDRYRVYVIP